MKSFDAFYSAFRAFAENSRESKWFRELCDGWLRAADDLDLAEWSKSHCQVDEFWVKSIEEALPDIDEAIRENRQFIKKEGEVVRIEQAKRVSKASVIHLARHSNLISEFEEDGETPTPEKIYIEENQDNFALYENRFLYMLLCYLRDFVDLRYNAVVAIDNAYSAELTAKKALSLRKNEIEVSLSFSENSQSNEKPGVNAMLDRIVTIQHTVASLLATDLMRLVSSAPPLTLPVVKTNVMKLNPHFIIACNLYEFLTNYSEPGYEIINQTRRYKPFPEELSQELSLALATVSFALRLSDAETRKAAEAAYEENLRLAELAAEKKAIAELERIGKVFMETGENPEEYVLKLEERLAVLEAERRRLSAVERRAERLQKQLAEQSVTLKIKTDEAVSEKHRADEAERRSEATTEQYRIETELLTQNAEAERNKLQKQRSETEAELENKRRAFEAEIVRRNAEADKKVEEMWEKSTLTRARLHALLSASGQPDDLDFTTEEGFRQLETEREAIEKLYQSRWRQTKKRIRREILWSRDDSADKPDADDKPDDKPTD